MRTAVRASAAAAYANPIGVHALVFAGDWTQASIVAAASGAAKAGYDLLEIPAFNADKLDAELTRRIFTEHGVGAACSLGLSLDADISSDDSAIVAAGAAELDKALNFAAAVGASHLCGILYSALAKYPAPPTKQGRVNCVRELKLLAGKAADRRVKVCLEVVNRYETNLLNTAAQAMELIEGEVQHPNVFVHLDSYHMNIEENSMEMAVRLCGPSRLGYVHLGESQRGYMGSGSVDFTGLFRGLADIGYTGPITFESFSSAVVSPDLSNNLCVWRNLWSDSGDLAQHARGYIHQNWRAALVAAQQAKSSKPAV